MTEAEMKSSSTSVSPPTPDTPQVARPTAHADGVSGGVVPDTATVAINMKNALDEAAQDGGTEAEPTPATASAAPELTLWDILGVPPPAVSTSQHAGTRVVLLGRALSGKRSICRRLCVAAERQFPVTVGDDDDRLRTHTADRDEEKQGLYWPAEGDEDLNDMDEWPEGDGGRRFVHSANHRTHMDDIPHGAGISHDYVVQRLPRPIDDPKTGMKQTHRSVEFFCCDSPGALAMAMPTLESLSTVVVCHVVDVSQPCSIEDQLNTSFRAVQTHVSSLLRTYLPNQDEVRRVQMMQRVEEFWLREEQRLCTYRSSVQARSEDETLVAEGVNVDEVNKAALRLPQGTQTVSPVRAIIICTKTDLLDHLAKACAAPDGPLSADERALIDVLVPGSMRDAAEAMNCSLPQLVAQLLRYYAIQHRCALAGVSTRVNTMSAPTAGESIPLVNPLYRALWAYICYLQEESAPSTGDTTASARDLACVIGTSADQLDETLVQASTAKLYPGGFLPCGLDALGLLSAFVASGKVTLPATDALQVDTPPPDWDHAAALRSCAFENGFHTHQAYLQGVQAEAGGREFSVAGSPDMFEWIHRPGTATSGRSEGAHERGDEPMLWDTL